MTSVQPDRSALLKLRNSRRRRWESLAKASSDAGLYARRLDDDQTESLAASLATAFGSAALEDVTDWTPLVRDFANGLSELTIVEMWDWDASTPICRVAASSVANRPEALAGLFSSGFFLVDEGEGDGLAVDLDFDDNTQDFVARIASVKLDQGA